MLPQVTSQKLAKFTEVETSILKILISVWKLKFLIGNKYCHLVSLKWQAHFIHFWKNICQISKSK